MDMKINREILVASEVVFEAFAEQSIELDYILPDYFPDIFKLIKCQLHPRIVSSNVSGDKLTFELIVGIKIMYYAEQTAALQCAGQKMNYSKTISRDNTSSVDCGREILSLTPKCDYVNCRVVNQRRLDIRGAISTKVKLTCEQKQHAICDAYGMNIQLKKNKVSYAGNKLYCEKRVTISEDFDLGYSKPSMSNVIRCDGVIAVVDKKIISNKVIVKGEAYVNVLYSCKKQSTDGGDTESLEAMQFTLPYSHIMDMDGVDERFDCMPEVSVVSCEVIPKSNSDGESKLVECEMILLICCTAICDATISVVTDAYSTSYPCDYTSSNARVEHMPMMVNESFINKSALEYKDGSIDCIYDAWCKAAVVSCKPNELSEGEGCGMVVTGNAAYTVMARNDQGAPIMLESNVMFEHVIPLKSMIDCEGIETSDGSIDYRCEITATVLSCSYTLASTNTVEVKAEIRLCGQIYEVTIQKILTDITLNEEMKKKRDGNYALKLYFADQGEDVWEIAKKYSTSVEAIKEENELFSDGEAETSIHERGMILIPIIG